MEARKFYLDTVSRAFVASPDATIPAPPNLFFREDVEAIELYFLRPTGNAAQPYQYLNYGSNTVKLAVGLTAPAALQTSWTSASTTVTASITTLTNGGSGANEVQRLTFSNPPAMGSYALTLPGRILNSDIFTMSGAVCTLPNHGLLNGQLLQVGSIEVGSSPTSNPTYTNREWFVVNRTKDTFGLSFTDGGAAIGGGGSGAGASFVLEVVGDFSTAAITTPQIQWNATANDIQQAFVEAGISVNSQPQIIVTGDRFSGFTFTFANTQSNINFGAMTVAGSTLAAAPALQANLSFNTSEVQALISAGTTNNLRLEVEVAGSGRRQTFATACDISADIITSTSPSPLPTTTANSFNLSDGAGGVWTVTVDASGILTTAKQ